MEVPDAFPEGSTFASDFGGDEWVKFPDGRVFKLDDSTGELRPAGGMPLSGSTSSEEYFRRMAALASNR